VLKDRETEPNVLFPIEGEVKFAFIADKLTIYALVADILRNVTSVRGSGTKRGLDKLPAKVIFGIMFPVGTFAGRTNRGAGGRDRFPA